MFQPRLPVESWVALNAVVVAELEAEVPARRLDNRNSVVNSLALEGEHLRAMPAHPSATCRVVARVADKFGNLRADHITYPVPVCHAYRSA